MPAPANARPMPAPMLGRGAFGGVDGRGAECHAIADAGARIRTQGAGNHRKHPAGHASPGGGEDGVDDGRNNMTLAEAVAQCSDP